MKSVLRPRLLQALDESLSQEILLVLVCGPAGYGKTTLVGEWVQTARQSQLAQFAWLTLERGDDDLTRFLTYFISALQHLQPGIGESVLKLLQTHKPVALPALATLLINELSALPGRIFLVLDDYHLLSAEPIQNFMSFLVDHQPPQLCLVLVTRADPALPLPRLRARRQLVELRQEALSFLPAEVSQFNERTMELALTPEQVSLLAQKTEGWVSGLQLAAVSLRATHDRAAFFDAFSGEHEFIADYLADEVLAGLPEQLRNFMLQTSILERLSASLCEAVSGQANTQATLEQLVESNLFLLPLDSQHAWYRYHTLIADLLRKRLGSAQGELLPELHRRASRWFEEHALPEPAIEHAISARQYERAAQLIEGLADSLLSLGQAATLLRWLEALPEEQVLSCPRLAALQGIAMLLCANPIRLVALLVEKMGATGVTGEELGEMNMMQALLAIYQADPGRTIHLSNLALQQLPEQRPFFRSLAADALGMGYTLIWDIPAATQAFEQVVEISSRSDNLMMTIAALSNLAGLAYVQGQLRRGIAICRQILDIATQRIGRQAPMLGKTLFNLGEMLREQGDLDGALSHLLESAKMMETFTEIGLPITHMAVARVYLNKGECQLAQSYLDKARKYAQATQSLMMDDRLVEVMQVRFHLHRGELVQAAQWARECGFTGRPPEEILAEAKQNAATFEVFQVEYLMAVRLLLAQSQPEQALMFISLLQEQAQKRQNQRRLLEVLVLKALALHQHGQLDQALQSLEAAFAMAEPEGYLRTFVDEGEPMARLLYQAAGHRLRPEYTCRLLAALGDEPQKQSSSPLSSAESLIEPLSRRELEVLRLIAEGLSNAEIAQRLYLSLSTVKGHTSNIFGKLSVKNRTQAIARARSLGLLPAE